MAATNSQIIRRRRLGGPTSMISGVRWFVLTRVSCLRYRRITRLVYNREDADARDSATRPVSFRAPARAGRHGRRIRSDRSAPRQECRTERNALFGRTAAETVRAR